jgi:hypothetical protein
MGEGERDREDHRSFSESVLSLMVFIVLTAAVIEVL